MNVRHRLSIVTLALCLGVAACGGSEPAKPATPPAPAAAKAPLVPVKKAADWCKEHGVPESMCTVCNEELIAGFKAKGDWCATHGVPESQCFQCKPELRAKFEAMAPK